MNADEVTGLPPIVGGRPVALFLGNAPSVQSLARRQYYGNPRNAFWPIMGALLGFDGDAPYERRTQAMVDVGYAVWDVLAFCRRPGSLDADVERDSMVANDFEVFFARWPTIERVYSPAAPHWRTTGDWPMWRRTWSTCGCRRRALRTRCRSR